MTPMVNYWRLNQTPVNTWKRLGDGFYEQKLVREQIMALTGYHFLGDYRNEDEQYRALMNSGLTVASQFNLRPGIALTEEQIAALTSDIVWLVEQDVTLPDGSVQKVLAPRVYARVNHSDLQGDGTLISADVVNINLTGNLMNAGTIAGRTALVINAENIQNINGTLQGGAVDLNAKNDIVILGGEVRAQNSLSVDAGNDIIVATTTTSANSINQAGNATYGYVGVDRIAGLFVEGANGIMNVNAGNNLTIAGATVSNAGTGSTTLSAKNDINITTVRTSESSTYKSDSYSMNSKRTDEVVSTLNVGGDLNISSSKGNVVLRGTDVTAGGDVDITATKGNVDLQASQSTSNYTSSYNVNDGDDTGSTAANSTKNKAVKIESGGTISVDAGSDITGQGTKFKAENGIDMNAGGVVTFTATKDTTYVHSESQSDGWADTSDSSTTSTLTNDAAVFDAGKGGVKVTSTGNQTFEATEFMVGEGKNVELNTKGKVIFAAVKDIFDHQETHSSSDAFWISGGNSSQHDETVKMVKLDNAKFIIKAAEGIQVDLKQDATVDQESIEATINALKNQPGMEWLSEMAANGKIDFKQIKEVHKQHESSYQGLGPASQIIVAIALSMATGGAGMGVMTAALTSSAASMGINALVANNGNVGDALNSLDNSNTYKNLLTAAVTAGATSSLNGALPTPPNLNTVAGVSQYFSNQLVTNLTSSTITAIVNDTDLGQAYQQGFITSFANTVGASGFSNAADNIQLGVTRGMVHAVTGAATGYILNGEEGALAGAVGAVTSYIASNTLDSVITNKNVLGGVSQLSAVLVTTAATEGEGDLSTANSIAASEFNNNYLRHEQQDALAAKLKACGDSDTCKEKAVAEFKATSDKQDKEMEACKISGDSACYNSHLQNIITADLNYDTELTKLLRGTSGAGLINNAGTTTNNPDIQRTLNWVRYQANSCQGITVSQCANKYAELHSSEIKYLVEIKEKWKSSLADDNTSTGITYVLKGGAYVVVDMFFPTTPLDVVLTVGGGAAKVIEKAAAKKAAAKAEQEAVDNINNNVVDDIVPSCGGTACFVAGTLVQTDSGLKPIETFVGGEMVWARNNQTLEYGYRPVVATKATPDQELYEIVVINNEQHKETYYTTAEHPFWIKDHGWRKASLLEAGMTLLDRNNNDLHVVSQKLTNELDTVFNIQVQDAETYHIGELGVWVHNADCCQEIFNGIKNSPNYPAGFRDVANGLTKNTVTNAELLSELRKVEPGTWKKVYKDGYDAFGNKISIHYFQSQSGKVFNVKVKDGWSN